MHHTGCAPPTGDLSDIKDTLNSASQKMALKFLQACFTKQHWLVLEFDAVFNLLIFVYWKSTWSELALWTVPGVWHEKKNQVARNNPIPKWTSSMLSEVWTSQTPQKCESYKKLREKAPNLNLSQCDPPDLKDPSKSCKIWPSIWVYQFRHAVLSLLKVRNLFIASNPVSQSFVKDYLTF